MRKVLQLGSLLILLSMTFALPSAAQSSEPNRTQIMAARATPARRLALPNGMVVLLKESPTHDLVAVELLCRAGIAQEETPMAGLIALWSTILQKRIDEETIDDYEIIQKTVSIEPDFLRISIVAPAKHSKRILKILADLMKNDQYDREVVLKERKILLNHIKEGGGARNQLYSIFRGLFYRYHPYRRQHTSGTLALERVDEKVLSEFHQKFFVSDRTVLSVVGRFSRTAIEDYADELFRPLKSANVPDLSISWEPKANEKRVDLNVGADIAWVVVGYPAPSAASRDHIPMMMIQTILSQGLSSRLFNEIREKRGLSYTISSVHPDLKGPSHFLTYVVTRPHDVGKVRREVLKQVERLKKEPLGQSELAGAKEKLRGVFLNESETVSGQAFRLARAESIGLGYGYEENFERNLQKVTSADLMKAASEYLVSPTIIIARPAGRFYWDG